MLKDKDLLQEHHKGQSTNRNIMARKQSGARSFEEIFSVNLRYVEIQAILLADLSHTTVVSKSEGLNDIVAAETPFRGSGPTSDVTLTWTCLMALGLMTLKARLNDSLDRPPSSVRAVRTRASRSAPTKP